MGEKRFGYGVGRMSLAEGYFQGRSFEVIRRASNFCQDDVSNYERTLEQALRGGQNPVHDLRVFFYFIVHSRIHAHKCAVVGREPACTSRARLGPCSRLINPGCGLDHTRKREIPFTLANCIS